MAEMRELLFEMDWVLAIRSEALTLVFRALTTIGSTWSYFLALPLVFSWRKATFARLLVLVSLTALLNAYLKVAYAMPRPAPEYHLVEFSGWSFPSGHAQYASAMWMAFAWETGRWVVWLLAILLSLGIGTSRTYLGVHYGRDVLAGFLVGLLTFVYFRWAVSARSRGGAAWPLPARAASVVLLQLLWLALLDGDAGDRGFLPAALLLGFWSGGLMRKSRLIESGTWRWGVTALVVGSVLVIIHGHRAVQSPILYIQFALLGAWMRAVVPVLLEKLRLPSAEEGRSGPFR